MYNGIKKMVKTRSLIYEKFVHKTLYELYRYFLGLSIMYGY